jgi:hypothetical protein
MVWAQAGLAALTAPETAADSLAERGPAPARVVAAAAWAEGAAPAAS